MSAADYSIPILLLPYLLPSDRDFTIWNGIVTMIHPALLCSANTMSVEGPYAAHTLPTCRSSRSNVSSTGAHDGLDVVYGTGQHYQLSQKSSVAASRETRMPVSTSSQSLLASLPSFMSVFGNGPGRLDVNECNTLAPQSPNRIHSKRPQHFSSSFPRRDSTSTFESTESSPTTTISTLESSLTEPSPQSPPESPDSFLPVSSFKSLRTNSVPGLGIMDQERRDHFSTSFPTLPGLDRGDSTNKKMRNMKNLSVNTSASNRNSAQLPKLGLSNQSSASHAFSAPPTPAFIVPPKVPRKKPSTLGLSITTPDAISNGQTGHERPSIVPQTPSDHQIRTLRALQTTNSGPLFSPTLAPEGGMRLPPFNTSASSCRQNKTRPPLSVSRQTSFDHTIASPITRQTLDHVQEEPDYDIPLSQEVKSPAYPQGPVCIYDPYVYLYLEPSHIEAREFDVVLNVAREVKNPFKAAIEQRFDENPEEARLQPQSNIDTGRLIHHDSNPDSLSATPEQPFTTALADPEETPSTPKVSRPEPEYVHIPWDHNTNVVDDLLRLCELIDSRARQEKRVLVHCQCGVSRSASLVVAYGIYKNPQLTVQEAYDAVKNRSRWIGPNMNLIYQLSEFKSKLPKPQPLGTSAWHAWRNNANAGRTDSASVLSPELRSSRLSSSLRAAPPSQLNHESPLLRASSFSPPGSAQLAQTSSTGGISPGPSSAPPNMHFEQAHAPSQNGEIPSVTDDNVLKREPSPPRIFALEPKSTLTASSMKLEAIEQKEAGPAGAVAHDLQEVAKDLNVSEGTSAPTSPPSNLNVDDKSATSKPLDRDAPIGIDSSDLVSPNATASQTVGTEKAPKPALQTQSPILPAGFSSLRRQVPIGLTRLPLRQDPPRLISVQIPQRAIDPDVPPIPSLLSPRAAEFTASPFHRTAAGDLAGSSVFEQGMMSPRAQDEDPRSPAQKGEAPIMRSIFDMI